VTSAYEANYHKIANLTDLQPGQPRVFRAAGATVLLKLGDDGKVTAIDGSCLADDSEMSRETRIKKILECVAAGVGSSSTDWLHLQNEIGLPVKVEGGEIWVCVDACRP
jgi:hypothetical protein